MLYQNELRVDWLEILQAYRIHQHNLTCVQNPWQLKREQSHFVEKTKATCLYKCIDDFQLETTQ